MDSSRRFRGGRWTDQHSRPRSALRSSTNYATTGLNHFSIDQDDGPNCRDNGSRKRQRTRSSSPDPRVANTPKLSLGTLPSFKKKPGRSLHEIQARSDARDYDQLPVDISTDSAVQDQRAGQMCCPNFLDALNGFKQLLEDSRDHCRSLERQVGALYKRLEETSSENAELRIVIEGLRRNINVLTNDRMESLRREEESNAKNAKLVEAVARMRKEPDHQC